jgi:hypothetical protein
LAQSVAGPSGIRRRRAARTYSDGQTMGRRSLYGVLRAEDGTRSALPASRQTKAPELAHSSEHGSRNFWLIDLELIGLRPLLDLFWSCPLLEFGALLELPFGAFGGLTRLSASAPIRPSNNPRRSLAHPHTPSRHTRPPSPRTHPGAQNSQQPRAKARRSDVFGERCSHNCDLTGTSGESWRTFRASLPSVCGPLPSGLGGEIFPAFQPLQRDDAIQPDRPDPLGSQITVDCAIAPPFTIDPVAN